MAHDAFAAWVRTHRFRLDEDHVSLDRVLVRYMDEELFANGESAAVARMTLFETISCRGLPRHPQIVSSCRRALRKDSLTLEVMVMLASDLLEQHRLLDKLAGLVMPHDLFTRPLETLKIFSRGVIAPKRAVTAGPPATTTAQPARRCEFDDTILTGLLGFQLEFVRVLLIRVQVAGSPDLPMLLPLRFIDNELALKLATRTRLTAGRIQHRCVQEASGRARHSGERPVSRCDLRAMLQKSW